MPSYTDNEKITIGSQYVFPRIIKAAGLPEGAISLDNEVWPMVVRPLGFDSGIRTLERTIEGIVRKVARLIVEGKGQSFRITAQNIREFLPQ
jgi:ATP-dependent Lon protease